MTDVETLAYGEAPEQVGDLHVPDGDPPWTVVMLVHGGFWARRYERDLMDALAGSVAERGRVAWNVEYRRTRSPGGGWPAPFIDVGAAMDHLEVLTDRGLDLSRVVVVGHSVGATMAVWLGARSSLPADAPWGQPLVVPRAVVAQAGVMDLVQAAETSLGEGAVGALLGAPEEHPERYDLVSPVACVPTGVPTLLVHGEEDALVPVSQSRRFAGAATDAGDRVEFVTLPDADHFAHLDPASVAWEAVVDRLPELAGEVEEEA